MFTRNLCRAGSALSLPRRAAPPPLRAPWRSSLFAALLALTFFLLLIPKTQAQNLFIGNYTYGATNTILRVSQSNGAFVGSLNTPNNLPPQRMLMGPDGNIYMVSGNSGATHRFNGATGAYLGQFSAPYIYSPPSNALDGLYALAFGPDNNLYAGSSLGIIKVGGPTTTSPGTNYGFFGNSSEFVSGLVFDFNCNLLAMVNNPNNDTQHSFIRKYSPQGTFLGNLITFPHSDYPQSVVIGPDRNLYISFVPDGVRGITRVYDINTGALIKTFIPQQSGLGYFNDIAWGPDNNFYVADEGLGPNYHGQVVRFNSNGSYLGVFTPYSANLIDPVSLSFIATPLGSPAPQTFGSQIAFRETNASIWGANGPPAITPSYALTFPWNTNGTVGGSGVYDIATPAINLGLFTIPAIDYGSFGGSFLANTHGTAGLNFSAVVTAGSANVNYPVTVNLTFPDRNYTFAGDWMPVFTSYTLDPAANMGTQSPHVSAEADLVMNGYLNVQASAVAFSRSIFNTTINAPAGYDVSGVAGNFNYGHKIFDTDALLGALTTYNYSFASGAITGYIKLPYITTTGMPDSSGVITTTGSDTFFNMRGSLSDYTRSLIQDETGVYVPIGSDSIGKHAVGSGFDAGYSFLDIFANLNLNVVQDFVFTPKPHVSLKLPTGVTINWKDKNNVEHDGVNTLSFDAGDSIQIQMPSNPILQLTPTYTLPNTFNHKISLQIDPSLNLNVLELTASGSVAGYTLGNFDYQPLPTQTINLATLGVNAKFKLWETNFILPGFQTVTQNGITVSGRLHPAPGLSSVSPNQLPLIIVPYQFNSTALPTNVSNASTSVMIKGYNFPTTGAQAYFTIHGSAPIALTTTTQDNCNLTAQIPNRYLLIAGTGQLYVTAPNTTGASNSLSVQVVNPVPIIRNVGPNVFAADPTFSVNSPLLMTVTDDSTTFLWSPFYYNTVKSLWQQSYNGSMSAVFPGYDFNTAASLPAIHFKGSDNVDHTLSLYEEAHPSGLLWAILPYSYYGKADTVSVTIVSPAPGGGVSNAIPLIFGYIAPQVTSCSPATVLPGSGAFRLTVQGPASIVPPGYTAAHGNFNTASYITWDGAALATTFINSGELRADIPASYVATAGGHTVRVVTAVSNGVGGGTTNYTSTGIAYNVKNPLPHLQIVDANATQIGAGGASNILNPPNAISADPGFIGQPTAPQYNLAVSGVGFVSTSVVQWNGANLTTQYVTDTLIKAAVPYASVATPTTAQVRVSNPTTAGGGGVSNQIAFTVTNAVPTLTTLATGYVVPGSAAFDLAVQGTGFYSGSVASIDGSPRTTNFGAQNGLTVHLLDSDLATAHTAQITVKNPTPGGGTSNALPLVIVNKTPFAGLAGAEVVLGGGNNVTIPGFGSAAPTSEITIEFWQYANAATGQSTLILEPDNGNNRINIHAPYSGGIVYWDFGNISGTGRLSYIPPVNIVGSWQHFAFVSSASGANNPVSSGVPYMAIYRNGVREAYKSGASSFTHTASDLLLGGSPSFPFGGQLDEVRIWNVARPAASIAADVNASLQGNEAGLFAYWKFDEGAGTRTEDATGHGSTGMLKNGAGWGLSGAAIDTVHVTPGVARPITLAGFDFNNPAQRLTFSIANGPTNGIFTQDTSTEFTYTPGVGYTGVGGGADTFTYTALNIVPGATASAPTTVKITYANPNTATVSGTLNFEGIASTAPAQKVTFTFRPTDASPVFTRVLQVPASGVFSVTGLPLKNYILHIKGDKYLAANVAASAAAGNVTGLAAYQGAGDSNNDNSVDPTDFGIFVSAYNSSAAIPGSGYDSTADYNGDGLVDPTDFGLFVGEYNNVGAP